MVVVPPGLISSGETLTRNEGLAAAVGNAKIPTRTATVAATAATLTVPCRNSIQSTTPALSLIRDYGTLRILFQKQPESSSICNDKIECENSTSLNEERTPRTPFCFTWGSHQPNSR